MANFKHILLLLVFYYDIIIDKLQEKKTTILDAFRIFLENF